jgi:peptide/nickel transport system permease protein
MNLWTQLRNNSLARIGAIVLLLFYTLVICADWVAPYDPYFSEASTALLPPTQVYWRNHQTQDWIGPHVYPTQQGALDLNTGDRT